MLCFRPYFEMKAQFNQLLEDQKTKVKKLEIKVSSAKASYAEALHNLEQISDEIHRVSTYLCNIRTSRESRRTVRLQDQT